MPTVQSRSRSHPIDLTGGRVLAFGDTADVDTGLPHEAGLIAAGLLSVVDPDTPAPSPENDVFLVGQFEDAVEGDVVYRGTDAWQRLGPSAASRRLTSAGPDAPPFWGRPAIVRWEPGVAYDRDQVVVNNGALYLADDDVPARSVFTLSDWTALSSAAAPVTPIPGTTVVPGAHYPVVAGTFAPTTTTTAAHSSELSKVRFQALQDLVSVNPVFGNFHYPDIDVGNNITIEAAIEYPTGTFTRVQFSGSNSKLLTPGAFVIGDDNTLTIPAGAYFWVRTLTTVAPGDGYAQPWNTYDGAGEAVEYDGSITHAVDSGVMTPIYGQYCNAPLCVMTTGVYRKSVAQVGDSITEGLGVSWGQSFIQKACLDAGIGYMMLGTPSETAVNAAGDYNRRRTLAAMCSTAVIEYGANDFNTGVTALQCKIASVTLWRYLQDQGNLKKLFACTVTPNAASTDGWVTTANQTPHAGLADRIAFNDWLRDGAPIDGSDNPVAIGAVGIRAGESAHPLDGIFDIADKVESTRNSGLWKVGPGPVAFSGDGIHPTPQGHAAMATALNPTLFS